MGIGTEVRLSHEGPRSCPRARGERVPLRASTREPSTVRRYRRRPSPTRHRCRQGQRRTSARDARLDNTSIRIAEKAFSTQSGVNGDRSRKIKDKGKRRGVTTTRLLQPRQEGHLRAHVPWSPARHRSVHFVRSQSLHALKIQVDTCSQGSPSLFQGRTVRRDVEIRADRVPQVAVPLGVASQKQAHSDPPNRTSLAGHGGQRTTVVPRLPETGARVGSISASLHSERTS